MALPQEDHASSTEIVHCRYGGVFIARHECQNHLEFGRKRYDDQEITSFSHDCRNRRVPDVRLRPKGSRTDR